MGSSAKQYSLVHQIRQSPPLDFSKAVDDRWIQNKTIVITGGASGFGAAFLTRWAKAGATVVIGDVNVTGGDQLVRTTRKSTGNERLHFFHCDVTDWQSQVHFFKKAVEVSPHGGIDTVVANAGIVKPEEIETPQQLDGPAPLPPNLKILDVNLTGVLYTTHLALFYLARNPGSVPASPTCDPTKLDRDRHLILVSSTAGLAPMPNQPLYCTSKHAVVGLYRSLRATSFQHGVRTNLLCPYFTDTPLLTTAGKFILAGLPVGEVEDVVEAATRFTADPQILGRGVFVGPKMKVRQEAEGQWTYVEEKQEPGEESAVFEVYVHDFEETELFTRMMVGLINRKTEIKGWLGWLGSIVEAIRYGLGL